MVLGLLSPEPSGGGLLGGGLFGGGGGLLGLGGSDDRRMRDAMLLAAMSAPASQRGQALMQAIQAAQQQQMQRQALATQQGALNQRAKQEHRYREALGSAPVPQEMRGLLEALPSSAAGQVLPGLIQQQRERQFLDGLAGGGSAPRMGGAAQVPAGPAPGGGDFFARLHAVENGTGDPGARNPRSTATGDFQFIDSTWRRFAAANPDLFQGMSDEQVLAARADPQISRRAAEWYARENAAELARAGHRPTSANLALAHRFGAAGAQALLGAAPETPIAEVVGEDVIRANPDLAGRTVGQVRNTFAMRFGNGDPFGQAAQGGGGAPAQGAEPVVSVAGQRMPLSQAMAVVERAPASLQPRLVQGIQLQLQAQRPPPLTVEDRIRIAREGRSQVNVTSGPQVGTIPQGYQLVREGETMRLEPIPGGPAARQEQDRQRAERERTTQRQQQGNVVVQDIDRILDTVATSALPVTGVGGSVLSRLPGTAARDVRALLDTLRANAAFERLQQMRQASPTGGALGQVTERELQLLQNSLGSLEQEQSQEQFVRNLRRLRGLYLDIIHGPGNWDPETGEPRTGGAASGGGAVPGPGGVGTAEPPPAAPRRLRYNPATGRIE